MAAMFTTYGFYRHFMIAIGLGLLLAPMAYGQGTNLGDTNSTPVPGAGHHYLGELNETVNPGNGSVSVRIGAPMPPGRKLTVPFSFAYDSDGQIVLQPSSAGLQWLSPTGTPGWSYSLPTLTFSTVTATGGGATCTVATNYMYSDANAGRHPLLLSIYGYAPGGEGGSCANTILPDGSQVDSQDPNGGDSLLLAHTNPTANNGNSTFVALPVTVADADGTVVTFSGLLLSGEQNLAASVEDRNGNMVMVNKGGSCVGGFSSYTDTLGRPALSASCNYTGGSAATDTITVDGLGASYLANYSGSATLSSAPLNVEFYDSSSCSIQQMNYAYIPLSSLKLPDGTSYSFAYDATYGLLNKITYPTGAYVRYVWGVNSHSEGGNGQGTLSSGAPWSCVYYYDTPVITDRYVSYDGSTEVLHQNFAYSTTWGNTQTPGWWTSKTTTVTTYDLLRGTSFQTVYTYAPMLVFAQPNTNIEITNQIPLESQVQYNDWGGTTLRTVNKSWINQYELECQSTTQGGLTSRIDYQYSAQGALVTDKKEWDWSQQSPCPATGYSAPSGTPTRETATSYNSYSTPIYTAAASILDKPAEVIVYHNGTQAAETTYAYDQVGVEPAGITEGRDTQYNGNTSVARGNLTTKSAWLNSTGAMLSSTYTNDDTGQRLSATDPLDNTTEYTYAPGTYYGAYLTEITYPATNGVQHTESFTYNFNSGKLATLTDENSKTTSYYYNDPFARLTETDFPDGGKTTIAYNDASNTPSVVTTKIRDSNASDDIVTTAYTNGLGHPIETVLNSDPAGADTTMTTLDGLARVWKVTNPYRTTSDPTYGVTVYTYDALGRPSDEATGKSIVRPDGSTVSTQNSANCVTIIDEAGVTRTPCTDGLARMSQATDATGTTTYGHDALNNLTSVSQGSQTRTFDYDSLGRLTSASNPENGTTSYTYDADGNLIIKTDARNITITYAYDALNRLEYKTYSDGTPTATFFYDQAPSAWQGWSGVTFGNAVGRMTAACTGSSPGNCTSPQTAVAYSYDAMGRTASYWQCTPLNCGNSSIWAATYTYDLAGNVSSWYHPAGITLTQGINNAGQIAQVTSSVSDQYDPASLATVTYTPFGAVSTLQNGCADGSGSTCANTVETYAYNNRMQMVMAELGNATSGATAISCRVYNYYAGTSNPSSCAMPSQSSNNNGNVAGYYYTDNVNALSHTATYQYTDGLNRLTGASATGSVAYSQSFSYDIYGNMSCSASPAEPKCLQTTYSSNRISYVTVSGVNTSYTYDAAGNLLNDGTYSYQWDAEGRLAAVTLSGSVVSMNTYNALGQRVEDVTQSSTTEEAYGAGGALLARYTGDTNSRSLVPFNGGLLAEYYCGGVIFDHPDELGSATTATDCTGKNVQERLYYPFGEFWNGAGSLGMHQEFAQLPDYDPETDEYNTPNRHYTPMGRWLTPDPSGVKAARLDDPQTWNMYAYTRNNPTTVTDPSGLVTPAVAAMSNEFPDIAAGSPFFSEDLLDMAAMMTVAQNEAEVNSAWHNLPPPQQPQDNTATPSLADIQSNIRTQANAYGIPQPIALATAAQESDFTVNARGSSGEVGLFQIMPSHKNEKLTDATGNSFKLDFAKAADPEQWQYNVKAGLALLKKDYDFAVAHAPNDVARATYAHYNAPGHWSQYQQYPKGVVAQHVRDWMVHYREFGGQ
jgi:RHS repeat-associated protein